MRKKIKTKTNQSLLLILSVIVAAAIIGNAEVRATKDYPIHGVTYKARKFLPKNENKKVENYEVTSETIRETTAYNVGDITQCSGDPCISANGENICLALGLGYKRCAANFVPFGTILNIQHFGNCMVTDRMNSRYKNSVDLAMKNTPEERQRAINFGRQKLVVQILK